jgi:hypothetical protein
MQNEYLPIGYKIGSHYEIVKVLGDDEFEIVYVVKDIHRLETLFVIKELFLKEYCFRDEQNGVYILEKSKESFQKTKENLIFEVNIIKERRERNRVQTYGYFEENNTLYTIMEFINSAEISNYLKIIPKKSIKEREPKPKVKIEREERKEKPKSYLFLKMLIASIVLFIVLVLYSFNMIEEDKNRPRENSVATAVKKTVIPHPVLTDRTQKEKIESDIPKSKITDATRYIPPENKGEVEKIEIDKGVPTEEIIEIEREEPIKSTAPKESIEVVYVPPKRDSIALHNNGPTFNKKNIKKFLESFISSAEENSIDKILSHYDTHIDRYFSINNATHKNIYRDKIKYNRKWVQRDFELLDFEILNISKINNIEYCDIRKKTRWSVSTNSGQRASGVSRVFMVLKRTNSGFKIKTIYSF